METRKEFFQGIHFRNGNQHILRSLSLPNESSFRGIIGRGINNDIPLSALKDKNVVIIGAGSSSTDNAARALMAGARSITIICRKRKLLYSCYATYQLTNFLNPKVFTDPNYISSCYDRFFNALRKVYKATDFVDIDSGKCDNVINYRGKLHLKMDCGADSFRGDYVLLGIAYGIIKIVVDEVVDVKLDHVICKNNTPLPCDILIKCLGYKADRSLLANHILLNSYFIDNLPNVTSTIGLDSFHGAYIFGPNNPNASFFIPNIFGFGDIDRAAIFYQRNPEKWQKFSNSPLFACLNDHTFYDIYSFISILPKLMTSGDEGIINIFMESLNLSMNMRTKLNPPSVFITKCKQDWEHHSKLLSERTGRKEIPFPYEEELQQALSEATAPKS